MRSMFLSHINISAMPAEKSNSAKIMDRFFWPQVLFPLIILINC